MTDFAGQLIFHCFRSILIFGLNKTRDAHTQFVTRNETHFQITFTLVFSTIHRATTDVVTCLAVRRSRNGRIIGLIDFFYTSSKDDLVMSLGICRPFLIALVILGM